MILDLEWLPFFIGLVHLALCPFTKVEESFNLQACHDILNHGSNLHLYDHFDFPGVVPRTFLGPLVISALAWPLKLISSFLDDSKFVMQIIVRCILGMFVLISLQSFRSAIKGKFGPETSKWHLLITTSQFHLMFYASRPLPNIFALILSLQAMTYWLKGHHGRFILTSAFVILVFRAELAILLGIILIMDLMVARAKLIPTIAYGLLGTFLSLGLTISIGKLVIAFVVSKKFHF